VTAYKVALSREDPCWVAVAYGDGLPPHGAATETRTIASLEENVRDVIVLRTNADLDLPYEQAAQSLTLVWDYDGLPGDAAAALREYLDSREKLAEAQERYARSAERAAVALTSQAHASVRDVAALMKISFQRVSQLLSGLRGKVSR